MRDLLDRADLARYAGQFVWLQLNFDEPANRAFLTKFGASATPTFYIIDPRGERVIATRQGAMSLRELTQFLGRGADATRPTGQLPADAALARGDGLLALKPIDAAREYREALRVAPAEWSQRSLTEASLVGALHDSRQWQECAETALADADPMPRDAMFGRIVSTGMWCLVSADPAPWFDGAARQLEALATEALSQSSTVRDHRDELYRTLMYLSLARNNKAAAGKWGDRWLAELDARQTASRSLTNEERSAIDIARVENVQVYGDPARILPALIASEQAMPANDNASLRVAQMQNAARHYDEAVAACDRGLARAPGANTRAWLLQTKAQALMALGKVAEARQVLEAALEAAQSIPDKAMREMNVKMITEGLKKF